MSFSDGLTWSSQNLTYSSVSPADLENSTTATSGATSKTSTVMANLPLRPSSAPCMVTANSFLAVTLKLILLATASSLPSTAEAENLHIKTEGERLLVSNKLLRSKPWESDEIISNAL
uniref:Uncharacterized protein n=1 Tax=Cajanus cajan TaxID=3821 RepID=A0A151S5J4_CAJCA|nr:hypothetical protein KK1_028260 [Cajanus cajan]